MLYTLKSISEILKVDCISHSQCDIKIDQILTDSRRLRNVQQTLFFALKTERNDGANYIVDLYKHQVRAFVIQDGFDTKPFPEAHFIVVKNSLTALQDLVKYHRAQFNIPIVGITGSNGKTIVKEWLFELLKKDKKIVRNPRSYNSQIGVPLSVWMLDQDTEMGIFEAGISQAGEMSKLEAIIQPNIGIFTNIGDAHQENFIDYKHKAGEKIKLFERCDTIIYCRDHQWIDWHLSNQDRFENKTILSWSEKLGATLRVKNRKIQNNSTLIEAQYQNNTLLLEIPFTDFASYENLMPIWVLLLHLGYQQELIQERISQLSHIAMRLEQKQAINGCTLINDSYNSDIGSLHIALDFLVQQYQHQQRTLILSDILQSGREAVSLYKDVVDLLKTKSVNRFIGIGHDMQSVANLFPKNALFFESTAEFMNKMGPDDFKKEAILIKGARTFEFEHISNMLQNKVHETVLEVNLSHLIHNVNYFKSQLKPEVKIMAMVKAFSYGAGSVEVANVLQFHQVDYLAVAYTDEGVALRKAGIALPIMVMNPEEQSFEQMLRYSLEPEIYSLRILKSYYQAVRHHGTVYAPLHIKIETGMNRLGFIEAEVDETIGFIQSNPSLKVVSVFSHLAGSDGEIFDNFTDQQIAKFHRISDKIIKAFDYKIIRHLSNSNGVLRHPSAQFDMVRLGIGMYGATDFEHHQLKEVNRLVTRISQIKTIKKGESIGYDRNGQLEKDGQIAILPIGYADGIRRSLSNGEGHFMLNGQLAPIVGNVCMDMCMLDVSKIKCKEGDQVIVFGPDFSIQHIAREMNTIPYEVLTGISQRVKRIYFQE
ncbi:MAG: bifunctional UDP-N-acetylmuramoyl-tripeptide:D-alanyl-D-alanine ligase/alanine racemase [Bacteroidales bacterium]|nr:bifunctional UDP-N-acetylmuramoyl-tripeptide:D-alanyl-D-alanine ligase/alanine racemase [Bacteroidales bacterium]